MNIQSEKIKDLAKSITAKLSTLAKKEKVSYSNILNSFLLERMAARLLSDSQLAEKLIFKGGYIGLRIFESGRYTVDLDALVNGANINEIYVLAQKAIQKNLVDGVWFQYEKQVDLKTQGEYGGLRLYFRTGIGLPITPIE